MFSFFLRGKRRRPWRKLRDLRRFQDVVADLAPASMKRSVRDRLPERRGT
jgi:hypothetical protein